ncbi:MAG: nuclear transport factor 2 family protein [Brachybacterium faecium]|nr:MAG: nuclear transport factor 2 family protein [Brachybacterium faecium]
MIAAWVEADRRQEAAVMRAQLSPAVELISPLTDHFRFTGTDAVMAVLECAFELLEDIEITALTGSGRDWVLHGTNTLGGQNLEEIQWLHLGEDGLIDRITLFIRPAPAAISLLAKIGPPLARRGALKPAARFASRAAVPIAAALRLADSVAMPRLARPPRSVRRQGQLRRRARPGRTSG